MRGIKMGSAKEGEDLESLAEELRNFDGVKRKRAF